MWEVYNQDSKFYVNCGEVTCLVKEQRFKHRKKKRTNKCIYFHGVPLSAPKLLIKSRRRREATGYFVHMYWFTFETPMCYIVTI